VPDACSWVHHIWEEEQDGSGIAEMPPAKWEAAALKSVSDLSNEATQKAFSILEDDASGTVSSEKVSRMLHISHGELSTSVALGGGLCVDGALDYNGFRAAVAGYAARARLQAEAPNRTHASESSSSSSDTYSVGSQQMPSEASACHEDCRGDSPNAIAGASLVNGQPLPLPPAVDCGKEQPDVTPRRRSVSFREPAEMVFMPPPEERHFVQKFVALCVGPAVAG
jgi:hypothetical protein